MREVEKDPEFLPVIIFAAAYAVCQSLLIAAIASESEGWSAVVLCLVSIPAALMLSASLSFVIALGLALLGVIILALARRIPE